MRTAILDGEAAVLDEKGRSDFGMLQRPLWRLPSPYETGFVVFYGFDFLYIDRRDLRRPAAAGAPAAAATGPRWPRRGDPALGRGSGGRRGIPPGRPIGEPH
ncbi:hypothetical protein [Ensifer aridi]|uniref:hypothetical protein n=1 Tax=Ensifer aridi TaxID=1708715 RepID=UPI003B8A87B3